MYQFIYDIDELKWFYDNILPPLNPTEVYFISLSARNKYLTDEEKGIFQLGRTEMFNKTIVRKREWERFLRTIRKFEINEGGYTTKNNSDIPQKCITCYININPSSTLQAISSFKKVLAEYEVEIASMALLGKKGDIENLGYRLSKLDNNLYTCYQNSRGKRYWIDIDMDVDKEYDIWNNRLFKEWMNSKKLNTFYFIDTKSGYHLLIKKDELKFNPQEIIDWITQDYLHYQHVESFNTNEFEIIQNFNEMIPVPGLFQGGYKVKVLNKGEV